MMSDTLSTSDVGVNAAGTAYVYAAGGVTQVPRGSTVTYGDWVTIDLGGSMPPSGIFEVQPGAAPVVPRNLGLWRTVTLTPLF